MKRKSKTVPVYSDVVLLIRDDIKHDRKMSHKFGISTIPGTWTFEVSHHALCIPIAIVWFRFIDNATSIDVVNSFTDARFRRCGLRRFINEKLFEYYPNILRITTDNGSDDGGMAFMKSAGYRRLPSGQGWELNRQTACDKKKKRDATL